MNHNQRMDDAVYIIHSEDEDAVDIHDEDIDSDGLIVIASDDDVDVDAHHDVDRDMNDNENVHVNNHHVNIVHDDHHDSIMNDVHNNASDGNHGHINEDGMNQRQQQHHHHQQHMHQQQQQRQIPIGGNVRPQPQSVQQQRQPSHEHHQMHNNENVHMEPRQGAVVDHGSENPNANNDNNSNNNNNDHRRKNSSSTEEIDDEPPLEGYERTNRIGQGAYGIVYKGVQRSTGHTVAIKRIPFGEATPEGGVPCNVIREISLLRELDHPNVVRLLDVNQAQPGELYLVFEFVAHDLKTFLDRSQRNSDVTRRHGLDVSVVRSFMRQILEGVGYCHMYRILHRDLKPHNLLISSDGRQLKLADFGLARLSGLPSGPYTAEVVTLWYRAPELLLGANRYCGPVDVWSIGCIFAEMATGYALFPGRSDIDQLFKIFQRRGTPNNLIWPNCTRLPYFNPDFPKWRQRHVREFMDSASFDSTQGSDLLEQLLQYDPDQRLVCKAALQHPFFFENS